jgi:hypothetical protein
MDSDDLIAEGFVSYHATTGSDGYETAEDTHTTNHGQPAESDTMAPTSGEIEAPPVHLGAYHVGGDADAPTYHCIYELRVVGQSGTMVLRVSILSRTVGRVFVRLLSPVHSGQDSPSASLDSRM